MQNYLAMHLPEQIVSQVGTNTGLLYSIIPRIGTFPEPLKTTIQQAFLSGLKPVWVVVTILSVAGFLSSLMMQDVPMHVFTDEKWDPAASLTSQSSSSPLSEKPGTKQRVPILE